MISSSVTPRIIRLDAMRYASAYGFGTNPEEAAWQNMSQWARPRGLLDDLVTHLLLGFNNPYPTAATPRYGYELWLKADSDVEPEGNIRIGEFFGGDYAVMRCEVKGHPECVPAAWQNLIAWCKENGKTIGTHYAFERFLSTPENLDTLVLDLYCPVMT
jgi:DNA gyrase inhibitor GyrI